MLQPHEIDSHFEKVAGASDLLNALPVASMGAPVGAIAAALTPTRSVEDQKEAKPNVLAKALIPGLGTYNSFKRIGTTSKTPGPVSFVDTKPETPKLENKLQAPEANFEPPKEDLTKSSSDSFRHTFKGIPGYDKNLKVKIVKNKDGSVDHAATALATFPNTGKDSPLSKLIKKAGLA